VDQDNNTEDGLFMKPIKKVNYYFQRNSTALTRTMLVAGFFICLTSVLLAQTAPYLTVAPTGTNQLFLTITNGDGTSTYDIYTTPVLGDTVSYPWTAAVIGTNGQTNFTVSMPYATGFYRAVLDTNGIPIWQAADPNNPGAGILTVFIDSPTNGAALQ
jgi:hypothetical protein